MKRIILSGIQPTGIPHLGNYVGAIRNWVGLQNENDVACGTERNGSAWAGKEIENREIKKQDPHDILVSVVDLHAITLPQHPKLLNRNILEMGMALLACGIDPSKSILFRQSKIQQHTQLAWILFCKTPVSWLSRMHQWKVLYSHMFRLTIVITMIDKI
jgi:tryptophanyl-tRNA synthetase